MSSIDFIVLMSQKSSKCFIVSTSGAPARYYPVLIYPLFSDDEARKFNTSIDSAKILRLLTYENRELILSFILLTFKTGNASSLGKLACYISGYLTLEKRQKLQNNFQGTTPLTSCFEIESIN